MSPLVIYVGGVIAAGAWLLAAAPPAAGTPAPLLATLAAAMLVVSVFKLRLPLAAGSSTISMAFAVDFVALLTAGVETAAALAAAGVLVQCLTRVRRRQPWYRTAFSVGAVVLAVHATWWVWLALGGGAGSALLASGAAALAYFAVNAGLVGVAITLSRGAAAGEHVVPLLSTAPAFLAAMAAAAWMVASLPQQPFGPVIATLLITGCHLAYRALFARMAGARAARAGSGVEPT